MIVDGLQKQKSLNGQRGSVLVFSESHGRYLVDVSGAQHNLREENLRLYKRYEGYGNVVDKPKNSRWAIKLLCATGIAASAGLAIMAAPIVIAGGAAGVVAGGAVALNVKNAADFLEMWQDANDAD